MVHIIAFTTKVIFSMDKVFYKTLPPRRVSVITSFIRNKICDNIHNCWIENKNLIISIKIILSGFPIKYQMPFWYHKSLHAWSDVTPSSHMVAEKISLNRSLRMKFGGENSIVKKHVHQCEWPYWVDCKYQVYEGSWVIKYMCRIFYFLQESKLRS